MPFAGFRDFKACIAANSDKDDPNAYCATIMRQVEGKKSRKTILAQAWKSVKAQYLPEYHRLMCLSCNHAWRGTELKCPKCGKTGDDISVGIAEKAREVGGYESPEPGKLPEKKKQQLAEVYASARKQGYGKTRAAKMAWGAVKKADRIPDFVERMLKEGEDDSKIIRNIESRIGVNHSDAQSILQGTKNYLGIKGKFVKTKALAPGQQDKIARYIYMQRQHGVSPDRIVGEVRNMLGITGYPEREANEVVSQLMQKFNIKSAKKKALPISQQDKLVRLIRERRAHGVTPERIAGEIKLMLGVYGYEREANEIVPMLMQRYGIKSDHFTKPGTKPYVCPSCWSVADTEECPVCQHATEPNPQAKWKAGVGQLPADYKKTMNGKPLAGIKSKLAGLWRKQKAEPEYQTRLNEEKEKEKKEHPWLSDIQARKVAEDHLARHSRKISHGKIPSERLARHAEMKSYAEIEAAFLKEGEWRTGGIPYKYDWEIIQRDMPTWKNREFFIGHSEESGLEYGLIKEVRPKEINGEKWAVAKIRVPESKFTQDMLDRIENGLMRYVSTTHSFYVNPDDPERKVQKIVGKAISTVLDPEVPDAKILRIIRKIRAG